MATEPATEQTGLRGPAAWRGGGEREGVAGLGPWRLGLRRLRRNKVALFFGFLFVLLVAVCLAAPLWANQVAKTGPDENHLTDTIVVDGEEKNVVAPRRRSRSARPGRASSSSGRTRTVATSWCGCSTAGATHW